MQTIRYERMLPHQIVARRNKFAAAFIPLGGLEWHGEHLAVGNDALKADKLCELAAAASGGFAMPPLWYGEPRTAGLMEANHNDEGGITDKMQLPRENFSKRHFGVTPKRQIASYQQLLYHVLAEMNTLGMKAVCLLAGHYPIVGWAAPAVERFSRVARYRSTRVFCGNEIHYVVPPAPRVAGVDHAAKWETSYLQYLAPECVDLGVYLGRDDEKLVGLMGIDPRGVASAEVGRRGCDRIVRGMVAKARELVRR